MTTPNQRRYWVLIGHWHGLPCAIKHGDYIPPFSCWFICTKEEWEELRREMFYARHQRSRPTAYVDRDMQKRASVTYQ